MPWLAGLIVLDVAQVWAPAWAVELQRLDRASGAVDAAAAPLTVVPAGARTYYTKSR